MKNETRADRLSSLLLTARSDVPSAADERALVAALEARIAAGGAGGEGGTPLETYPAPPRAATRAWAIAAPIVVAGGVALWIALRAAAPSPDRGGLAPPAQTAVAAVTSAPGPASGVDPAPPASSSAPPLASQAPHGAPRTPAAPTEAALIESARAAVARDPGRALGLTEAHRRTYPRGDLAPEREVIAIDALVRLGRRPEAVLRADAFRAAHPRSIHTARIAAILGEKENRPGQ